MLIEKNVQCVMTSVNMYVRGGDEIITFPTPTPPSGFDMVPHPPTAIGMQLFGVHLTYGLGEKEARRPTPKWNTRFYLAFSIRA